MSKPYIIDPLTSELWHTDVPWIVIILCSSIRDQAHFYLYHILLQICFFLAHIKYMSIIITLLISLSSPYSSFPLYQSPRTTETCRKLFLCLRMVSAVSNITIRGWHYGCIYLYSFILKNVVLCGWRDSAIQHTALTVGTARDGRNVCSLIP